MYKKMRRAEKQLSQEEAIKIINDTDFGILSLSSGNKPYGVPVNTVLHDNKIYFHCATEGLKIDIINANPYGHFVFVSKCKILEEKATTSYKSTTVHGRLRIVDDPTERNLAFNLLISRYMGSYTKEGKEMVKKHDRSTLIIAMDIKEITAKGSKE